MCYSLRREGPDDVIRLVAGAAEWGQAHGPQQLLQVRQVRVEVRRGRLPVHSDESGSRAVRKQQSAPSASTPQSRGGHGQRRTLVLGPRGKGEWRRVGSDTKRRLVGERERGASMVRVHESGRGTQDTAWEQESGRGQSGWGQVSGGGDQATTKRARCRAVHASTCTRQAVAL